MFTAPHDKEPSCACFAILLQLLILAFFIPVLYLIATQRPLELAALVAAGGLFIWLMLLTLLLREQTAQRLDPGRDLSHRVIGALVGFIGCCLIGFAWLLLSGQYVGGRRGQLLLLVIELIGPWLPAAVFFFFGLKSLKLAFSLWRGR